MNKIIEQKRKEKGLTIKELCKECEISVRSYHNIKDGSTKLISINKTYSKLLNYLKINELPNNLKKYLK